MNYKKAFASLLITSVLFISSLTGCGAAASADSTGSKADSGAVTKDSGSSSAELPDYGKTADASDMTDVDPVGEDWMTPIGPEGVVGTAGQAAKADEADFIPFEEDGNGAHTFTIPVKALDEGFPCAAYSKRKEQWYDRTLLVRSDSLPDDALLSFSKTEIESLALADGQYTAEVTLQGGSGKAQVASPARLTVENGTVTAEIIWSSNKYDYMKVADVRYDPVSTEEHSVFEIPVDGFDYAMPVIADTTAMSTPHEIEYTLFFDSKTITQAEK